MSDLNILLRRINQRKTHSEAGGLEHAAAVTLVSVLTLVGLASLL